MERPRRDDVLELEVGDLAFGGAGGRAPRRLRRLLPRRRPRRPDPGARDQGAPPLRRGGPRRGAEPRAGPRRAALPLRPALRRLPPAARGLRGRSSPPSATRWPSTSRASATSTGSRCCRPTPPSRPSATATGWSTRRPPGPAGELTLGFHARGRWDEVIDVEACLLATALGNAVRETVRAGGGRGRPRALRPARPGRRPAPRRRARGHRHRPGAGDAGDRRRGRGGGRRGRGRSPGRTPSSSGVLHAVNAGVAETTAGHPTRVVAAATGSRSGSSARRCACRPARSSRPTRAWPSASTSAWPRRPASTAPRWSTTCSPAPAARRRAPRGARGRGDRRRPRGGGRRRAQRRRQRPGQPHRAPRGRRASCCASAAASCRPPTSPWSDPPRAGLSGRAVRRVLELAPPTLVYVSCQPATFADNAARFVEGGYRLEWVRPVDMFPQTPHIEAVARFTRVSARCRAPPSAARRSGAGGGARGTAPSMRARSRPISSSRPNASASRSRVRAPTRGTMSSPARAPRRSPAGRP